MIKLYRTSETRKKRTIENRKPSVFHECNWGIGSPSVEKCRPYIHYQDQFGIGEFSYCRKHARIILIKTIERFNEKYDEEFEI